MGGHPFSRDRKDLKIFLQDLVLGNPDLKCSRNMNLLLKKWKEELGRRSGWNG